MSRAEGDRAPRCNRAHRPDDDDNHSRTRPPATRSIEKRQPVVARGAPLARWRTLSHRSRNRREPWPTASTRPLPDGWEPVGGINPRTGAWMTPPHPGWERRALGEAGTRGDGRDALGPLAPTIRAIRSEERRVGKERRSA